MNVENINRLADHIAGLDDAEFNMGFGCKCYGGHTQKLFEGNYTAGIASSVSYHLGLSYRAADDLCYPGTPTEISENRWYPTIYGGECGWSAYKLSRDDAVKFLRGIADGTYVHTDAWGWHPSDLQNPPARNLAIVDE